MGGSTGKYLLRVAWSTGMGGSFPSNVLVHTTNAREGPPYIHFRYVGSNPANSKQGNRRAGSRGRMPAIIFMNAFSRCQANH